MSFANPDLNLIKDKPKLPLKTEKYFIPVKVYVNCLFKHLCTRGLGGLLKY